MTDGDKQKSGVAGVAAWLWLLAAFLVAVLASANLFLGEVNQDEGWYLYAARLVSEGQRPFIDFATTQGPVMPYVYSVFQPLMATFGVAGGRMVTVFLGFAGVAAAALLAWRLASPSRRLVAAFAALCLVGVNVYQSYFCAIVKTYALAGLLLTLGLLLLSSVCSRSRGWLPAFVAGVVLMLAGCTRTSAGAVLPVVFVGLLAMRRPGAAVSLCAGAALTFALVLGPFALKAPDAFRFAFIEYHMGRQPGGLGSMLAYKVGFLGRVVQDYFVPVALLAGVVLWRWLRPAGKLDVMNGRGFLNTLWGGVAAVTLLHMAAPFPYDDYQVIIFPAFGALLAVELVALLPTGTDGLPNRGVTAWSTGVLLLVCTAAAFSSPVNQSWVIGGRDRIWWPVRSESSLFQLQKAGAYLRSISAPGDVLLTQDTYLAVEAGLKVPAGMELGPFCYYPDWDREKARRRHVLNREMLVLVLDEAAPAVALLSGWSFAIRSPQITELEITERDELCGLVERRYMPVLEIPRFGHAETTLKVYRRGGVTEREK